jgi:hypothetical protein
MKKTLLFASLITFAVFSCGEKTTTETSQVETHTTSEASTAKATKVTNTNTTAKIIDGYLAVKDALVADDQATAAAKSADLVSALKAFDSASAQSNQTGELEKFKLEATALAENLASGDIATQRENFQALSVALKEFFKIAGADRTLYHQYCPMYKGNKGGMWLSAKEDIKNPLFGSSMLTCGRVEETLTLN